MAKLSETEIQRIKKGINEGGTYERGVILFYREIFLSLLFPLQEEFPDFPQRVISRLEKSAKELKENLSTSHEHQGSLRGFLDELDFFRQKVEALEE